MLPNSRKQKAPCEPGASRIQGQGARQQDPGARGKAAGSRGQLAALYCAKA